MGKTEATGYGLVYYVGHMLEYAGAGTWAGKRVAISGSGNVAQYAALKLIELGATVVSLSDSKGALVAEGDAVVTPEDVAAIAELKLKRKSLTAFDHKGKFKYIEGARPWVNVGKIDVALPCATQNEVSKEEAEALVAAGAKFVAEGSNMGCTAEAIEVFEKERKEKKGSSIWYAPGKFPACLTYYDSRFTHVTNGILVRQAKQPTAAAWPSRDSKWRRTASVYSGPGRRWTRSSRAS